MSNFVGALVVFAAAMIGMAIGVLISNRCLRGSCGGLSGMKDEHGNPLCESCSNPSTDCRRGTGRDPSDADDSDESVASARELSPTR